MSIHHPGIHHHHRHHNPPAIIMKVGDEKPVPLTLQLKQEYERLYTTQVPNPDYQARLLDNMSKIIAGWDKYTLVSGRTNVPWYVIGVMHLMECDCHFDCHLHNGDPIAHRTIHIPRGRPQVHCWTWEDSAVDALQLEGFAAWTDWSISGTLYRLESYNGFGYRNHGIPTPYLWSGTRFYTRGKYGTDGHYDPTLKSSQTGAALVLKTMNSKNFIEFPKLIPPVTFCEPLY